CGAKINAAEADLGSTAGEIWISQACGTSQWSTVTISNSLHALRFIQGGTYLTGLINLSGNGDSIVGEPCQNTPTANTNTWYCPVKLKTATGGLTYGIQVANSGSIRDIDLDGSSTSGSTVGIKIVGAGVFIWSTRVHNFVSHGVTAISSTVGADEAA